MDFPVSRRPAAGIRAEIDALRREIGSCTVAKFATSKACHAARARLEHQVTVLMAELIPAGMDPRFVSADALDGLADDVVADLLAAARWTARCADRATYEGVCAGDCALDSVEVLQREMEVRGMVPAPATNPAGSPGRF
jgi:hypothetical protein